MIAMIMMFTMIMTIIAMVIMPNLSSISDVVESGTGGMVWNFPPVQSVTEDVQEQPSGHCKNIFDY